MKMKNQKLKVEIEKKIKTFSELKMFKLDSYWVTLPAVLLNDHWRRESKKEISKYKVWKKLKSKRSKSKKLKYKKSKCKISFRDYVQKAVIQCIEWSLKKRIEKEISKYKVP